jgi:hypothetical protein
MNYQRISKLQDSIKNKREKLTKEKDNTRRQILKYQIEIDEYRMKIEKLKGI